MARGEHRGRFVVIVGPDGAGKTTLAAAVADRAPGGAAYFHFLPRRLLPYPPTDPGPPPPKKAPDRPVLGWLRLARNWFRASSTYWTALRPALDQGSLVVADRWVYGYVGQPGALRFAGPEWLARLAVRVLPRPDLVLNLTGPAEVLVARKPELTVAETEAELTRWLRLPVPHLVTLDATLPPEELADRAWEALAWR